MLNVELKGTKSSVSNPQIRRSFRGGQIFGGTTAESITAQPYFEANLSITLFTSSHSLAPATNAFILSLTLRLDNVTNRLKQLTVSILQQSSYREEIPELLQIALELAPRSIYVWPHSQHQPKGYT